MTFHLDINFFQQSAFFYGIKARLKFFARNWRH